MAGIDSLVLESDDPAAAAEFVADAGVPAEGSGSHRILIGSQAGPFADPDGFAWVRAGGEQPTASSSAQGEPRAQ